MSFLKGDPNNPKVGDKFFLVPRGALFIVRAEVTEMYTQDNWSIETASLDEPLGHDIYGFDDDRIYMTFADARIALEERKAEAKRSKFRYSITLQQWRNEQIKFIASTGNNEVHEYAKTLKKKKFWR